MTRKWMGQHKNTLFVTKMPGSTQKYPTQYASVAIAIIKHPHIVNYNKVSNAHYMTPLKCNVFLRYFSLSYVQWTLWKEL